MHAYLVATLKMMLIANMFFTSPILLTANFSQLVLSLEMVALASGPILTGIVQTWTLDWTMDWTQD